MECSNPFVRLMIYGKIKRMIYSLKGVKLKPYKQKMVRGIFKRKIKEFDENYKEQDKNRTLYEKLQFGNLLMA